MADLLKLPLPEMCALFERSQASQNVAMARAVGAADPASGAVVLELRGGIAVFLGEGHPLNQGLALGLGAPLADAGLDALEALLGRGGHPIVVELTPGADADLGARLARRGYFVRQFQQVWARGLKDPVVPRAVDGFELRPVESAEESALFARLVMAGFTEQDELPPADAPLVIPAVRAAGTTAWIAWQEGRPVAGATVGLAGNVAALSGCAVLPRFRGRGLQRALLEARLAAAQAAAAEVAVSATVPASISAENLMRCGFQAAYPKIEMANGANGANGNGG
ncbi:MAG TPA: GNAT family N-acetyltransferase [Polyangiaceae bacterium]|jgi:GNAT superfamily N-acetyltransferase